MAEDSPILTAVERQAVDFTDLDTRRITLANPPPRPPVIYRLAGQQICTPGNLTGLAAQAKAGKSATIGAMLAAAMVADAGDESEADCLGFTAHPTQGKAVILFDTEQSPYDAFTLVRRAARRAQVAAQPPHFRLYCLADLATWRRRDLLTAEMERASRECAGIHSVFIDGGVDLCVDPNDPKEAFPLVEELMHLAVKHHCPLIIVLHENPAAGLAFGKTRGHFGSQLERKAESNLRVRKEGNVSTIFSERCRSASIPKDQAPSFEWSTEDEMHVSITVSKESTTSKNRTEHAPAVEAVFADTTGGLPWGDLMERLLTIAKTKGRTAERRISTWLDLGLIKKSTGGSYLRA